MKKTIRTVVSITLVLIFSLVTSLDVFASVKETEKNQTQIEMDTKQSGEQNAYIGTIDDTNDSESLNASDGEKTNESTVESVNTEESLDKAIEDSSQNSTEQSAEKSTSQEKKETTKDNSEANETVKPNGEGEVQGYDKYVTVNDPEAITYKDFSGEKLKDSSEINGKTFYAKEKYNNSNGKTYLSLYDNNNNWYGYIESNSVIEGTGKQGAYQSYWKYVTITSKNYEIFSDFSWNVKNATKNLIDKTYQARGKYQHINGSVYLSLYDNDGNWCGYVNEKATELGEGRQGAYRSYWKYVTITSKNYEIFSDFSWNVKNTTKNVIDNTYQARGKYQHLNGATYLSLYDNDGNFQGYVNENATKVGSGRQGIYQEYNEYVTITSKYYDVFSNFSWNKINSTNNVFGKTYRANGRYHHLNGATYLSLYDNNGKWCGYVNANATQVADGRQGVYQKYGKYVSVTNKYYEVFSNFSWNTIGTTNKVYGWTYEARGKYQHLNGSTYLSLYDTNGRWCGYVNEKATQVADGRQGVYQSFNKYVIISSSYYDMFRNFNWETKQSSAKLYNKGLIARGKYNHINGSTYYSIYDARGNWQGYINANGTKVVTYKENYAPYYSQMDVGAINGCAATSLYTALKAKNYAPNVSLVSFINGLPLSDSNPDEGQIGDPWGNTTFRKVISPVGLNKYANRYTKNTEILTGSSIDTVINEINSGNQVLYWGVYAMRDADIRRSPDHVMIARGYKNVNGKEYILIQEPGVYSYSSIKIRWYEKNAFDAYLSSKYRMMMVVR